MAGLAVAMVLIPQSIAYAYLAGLPPQTGLYAAFLPVMVAAIFGSSRQLSTGPIAIGSLMSATALQAYMGLGFADLHCLCLYVGFVSWNHPSAIGSLANGLDH